MWSRVVLGSLSLAALALTACGGGRSTAGGAPAAAASAPPPEVPIVAPSSGLDGEALVERTCTMCHDLRALPAYAPYWDEEEWRSMVETMIGYGAVLADDEFPVLVRYLGERY
jgi:cytochrome c5